MYDRIQDPYQERDFPGFLLRDREVDIFREVRQQPSSIRESQARSSSPNAATEHHTPYYECHQPQNE